MKMNEGDTSPMNQEGRQKRSLVSSEGQQPLQDHFSCNFSSNVKKQKQILNLEGMINQIKQKEANETCIRSASSETAEKISMSTTLKEDMNLQKEREGYNKKQVPNFYQSVVSPYSKFNGNNDEEKDKCKRVCDDTSG